MCYTYDAQSRVTKRTVIDLANNTSKDEVFASVGTAIASGLGTVIGLAAGLFVGWGADLLFNWIQEEYIDDIVENN